MVFGLFKKKTDEHRKARILTPTTCRVEVGTKISILDCELGLDGNPDFVIYLDSDSKWTEPKGESISNEEMKEIIRFASDDIRKRDGVEAVINFSNDNLS